MANTYTQIYIHVVFAVEGRQNLIRPEHNDELQKYITGIVSGQKQKLIAINNMPDHLHLLVGLQAGFGAFGFGARCESRFFKIHQREALGGGKIFVAGRIRRVFLFALATRRGDSLH